MNYKVVPIPEEEEKRTKTLKKLKRNSSAAGILTVILGFAAVLFLIGAVITIVVCELKDDESLSNLLYILTGAFGGAALVCAPISLLLSRLSDRLYKTELDFRERTDGEHSFFAGEGTLCTFEERALVLHSEDGKGQRVSVPYSEMRFFSVCTRRKPAEKGEWCVVFEVPLKYIGKKGKYKQNDPPALIQTEAKERLYRTLEAHGLELLGELPQEGKTAKYNVLRKFAFPDRRARKRALLLLALGGAMLVGGIIAAIFWNVPAGSMLSVLGAFVLGRATLSFVSAKSLLCFYTEGIYWKEKNRAECMFLKWEELTGVSFTRKEGFPFLKAETVYGSFHFPSTPEAEEYYKENFADKAVKS